VLEGASTEKNVLPKEIVGVKSFIDRVPDSVSRVKSFVDQVLSFIDRVPNSVDVPKSSVDLLPNSVNRVRNEDHSSGGGFGGGGVAPDAGEGGLDFLLHAGDQFAVGRHQGLLGFDLGDDRSLGCEGRKGEFKRRESLACNLWLR
jgi:hypothetical protein